MPPIPFALPDIGQEEIARVVQCLESGWLTTGPVTREFEQAFSAMLGGADAVAVNSASAGLILAMEALGIGPGDEVITTPYTFSATAMGAVHLGATPVLVDIDPATLNIDPKLIAKAITPKTKAIIPVHFAGLSCDMAAIRALADKHGLKVIADAAHALPTRYRGELVGADAYADATVFSFYATKTITTGEGGMITTRHPEVAARCRIMRLHGFSRDAFDRYKFTSKPQWYYEVVAPGFKCNLTDIASAIGIEQLKKAKHFQERRAAIGARYMQAFSGLPLTLPPEALKGDIHAWHLFVIRLRQDAPLSRDEFIQRMLSEHQVACSVHFIPLPLHPYWQEQGFRPQDYPMAIGAYEPAVSLPIYTRMTDTQVGQVIDGVQALLASAVSRRQAALP